MLSRKLVPFINPPLIMKTLNLNSEDLHTAASMLKVLGHPIRI